MSSEDTILMLDSMSKFTTVRREVLENVYTVINGKLQLLDTTILKNIDYKKKLEQDKIKNRFEELENAVARFKEFEKPCGNCGHKKVCYTFKPNYCISLGEEREEDCVCVEFKETKKEE